MTKVEVTNIVKKSLVKVVVKDLKDDKIISVGSGTVINDLGFVLTAYHVVNTASKRDSYIIQIIPYQGGGAIPYEFIFGGITMEMPDLKLIKPLLIDMAILAPLKPTSLPYIELLEGVPTEGTETIMAGFPSDLKTPLDVVDNIDEKVIGEEKNLKKIQEFSNSIITWIMVKHGIIGSVFHLYAKNMKSELMGPSKSISMHAAEFWVDNTYAKGASGGPVVDMNGKLIGIITETSEVSISADFVDTVFLYIPSGSVRVLSHKLLSWSFEELKKQWKSKFK